MIPCLLMQVCTSSVFEFATISVFARLFEFLLLFTASSIMIRIASLWLLLPGLWLVMVRVVFLLRIVSLPFLVLALHVSSRVLVLRMKEPAFVAVFASTEFDEVIADSLHGFTSSKRCSVRVVLKVRLESALILLEASSAASSCPSSKTLHIY